MNMKNLKWAQVVLLALLILLPKQISAYQKKVLLSPTRNYTIHGRIVRRLFYKPPYIKC